MNFLYLVLSGLFLSWIGFGLFFVGEMFGRYPQPDLSDILSAISKGAKYAIACTSPFLLAFAVFIGVSP